MQGLLEFAKTLGAPRIAAMAAVTLALVGFFAFLILRVTAPQMTPLFTDLSYEDSSAIVKDLERQGVAYELRNDGGTVMVPKDRVARLRMSLAGEGLPKGGGVGYEIFDKSDALGTTSFIQNINNLRALEGELARTIRGLDRVVAARVHLVLPERPLFSRDKVDPSASIVLKVHGALEPQQVRAIRHLVASAVNGLKPQRVSIVDEAGRLLADGTGNDEFGEVTVDERRASFEKRLRDQVEAIVSSVVGPGRARIQVSADFDFNRITETSDKFDPEGRVVRSSQTREETSATESRDNQVTVGNEIPGGGNQRQQQGAAPKQKIRRDRQLRDIEDDQDRSDRGRPHQPHLGGGPGGRRLRQGQQGRHRLSAAHQRGNRPDRGAGAHRDRLRPEARRPGGGRQSAIRRDALGAIENIKAEPSETARKIDIAQIQGQVHAQSVQKRSVSSPTGIRAKPFPSSVNG